MLSLCSLDHFYVLVEIRLPFAYFVVEHVTNSQCPLLTPLDTGVLGFTGIWEGFGNGGTNLSLYFGVSWRLWCVRLDV